MFDLEKYDNNVAIITDSNICIKYLELSVYQKELLTVLNGRSLIFILCDNALGSLIGYLSCIINKIVPVLLDCNINRDCLISILKAYRPNYVWLPSNIYIFDNEDIVFDKWGYKLVSYMSDFQHNIHKDLAVLLPTSGSTGSLKMVRISYANLIENAKSIIEYLNIGSDDKAITSLPMSYSFGISIINTHLLSGACLLVTNKKVFDVNFWSFFRDNNGTSIAGVPYTYTIMRKINISNMHLPTLKVLTQAGGKISANDLDYFIDFAKNRNCKFYVMYGQTEATARISYVPYNMLEKKKGSIGVPIPGGTLSLYDKENNEIDQPYKLGELVYRGKNVSLGYAYNYKCLDKSDENNSIVHTGDLGYVDNDNYFYLVGRIDRTVKILGYRVSLDELESILEYKYLNRFICMQIENIIFIIGNINVNNNEIISYISSVTKMNMGVFKYVFLSDIPRTYNGKINYNRIRQIISDNN